MKKVLALVTTLALAGAIYVTPAKDQNVQTKQVAKDVQIMPYRVVDPGTGMG